MMKYSQTFIVKGSCQFPVDMLRYDRCFPRTEQDSYKLTAALDPGCDPWEITLLRYVETSHSLPTSARWKSFLATVLESTIQTEKL